MRFEPVLSDPRDESDNTAGRPPRPARNRPDPLTSITPPLGPNGIPGEAAPGDAVPPAATRHSGVPLRPAQHGHSARHSWPLVVPVSAAPAGNAPAAPPVSAPPVSGPAWAAPPTARPTGAPRPGIQPGAAPATLPPVTPPPTASPSVTPPRPAPPPVAPPPTALAPATTQPATPDTTGTGALARPRTDFALVRELRRELSTRLTRWQRGREFTIDEEDVERARIAVAVVAEYADQVRRAGTPLTAYEERVLLDQVTAELVGLGRLQTLLVDDTIEEVHILGCDQVRITRRNGQVDWHAPIADSDDELVEILQAAARRAGATERSLSTSKPTLDLQLPDGSRLAAVYLVSHRPYAVIRKHNTLDISLDDVAGGRPDLDEMIDVLVRDFLRASMRAGLNIMVAGLAGAGKTTIIRALMDEIPPDEPYVLLEESRELLPARRTERHRAVMSFEAREGHGERGFDGRPAGEVSIADLIPVSLRMGVLRIIVGEVRSREIVPMLQAMTTSRGSMCTIHARTPSGVGERIVELALSHGREMTVDQARRMAGNALDLIVYVTVEDETGIGGRKHRFVSHVEEVIGVGEGGRIATTTVFGPGPDGRAVPRHLPERIREQLLRVGYDARMLSRYIEAGVGAWRRPRHTVLRGHR